MKEEVVFFPADDGTQRGAFDSSAGKRNGCCFVDSIETTAEQGITSMAPQLVASINLELFHI